MRQSKNFEPMDEAVSDALIAAVQDSGVSYRELRRLTGLSINRIGIILRKEPPPATMGEIYSIAAAVGVDVVQMIREADRQASSVSDPIPTIDPEALGLAAMRDTRDQEYEANN
ncbi:hypothetical protein [Actinobaculum sp. 352]|uniref:hypothetical protein n=1 Tax=Actinobaculum sp. 352 TaxID=2490946 RepID=UPI000F7DFA54|nr:hypothetical protein [Actinobaculum sp. 352]RTE49610.1 hypothetical protein EKN07_06085 [Actinobaculum sp. 352]